MTDPVLSVENLCKSFGALKASSNVNLDLVPGEIHALIGPNGAGKSTLVSQIAGNLKSDLGTVHMNGENITGLSVAARAQRGLGRCFQISNLAMPLSVRRNVMIVAQAISGSSFRFWQQNHLDTQLLDATQDVLARIGLEKHASTRVSQLSHGERRQVEIACALALKPKILLLDEPMAGLGAGGSARLADFLEELKHEVPILLIEHDMDAVFRLADRISVLVYGEVVAHGNAEQIRSNEVVREAYLGSQE